MSIMALDWLIEALFQQGAQVPSYLFNIMSMAMAQNPCTLVSIQLKLLK